MSISGEGARAHGAMIRRVAVAAVATASALVAMKAIAYLITDSVAIMASLADSALDVFASFVNLLAVRHALTPADREHRFGHGKAEPLAGLVQGAFIAGSAAFLVIESIGRMIEPRPIGHGTAGLVVMAVSILATVCLIGAQRIVVRRTGSLAIGADSLHYVSDVLTNVGVMAAIVLATSFGLTIVDPIFGFMIAGMIAYSAWRVSRTSYDQLMDRELPDADRERIKQIVMRRPAVLAMHDLRTRAAGTLAFIQLHIELDPTLSLMAAHALSDEVERDLLAAFPNAEVIIHQDPAGLETVSALAKT
jgi:ferrous-iron efflux pump FieF